MRKRSDHGAPIEMIPKQKQTNIIHAATIYLIRNYLFCKVFCRFDVVGISPASENQQTPDITWIKDAFQVQY
jgi:Holliday junction resolvase-like predicted endonuclease